MPLIAISIAVESPALHVWAEVRHDSLAPTSTQRRDTALLGPFRQPVGTQQQLAPQLMWRADRGAFRAPISVYLYAARHGNCTSFARVVVDPRTAPPVTVIAVHGDCRRNARVRSVASRYVASVTPEPGWLRWLYFGASVIMVFAFAAFLLWRTAAKSGREYSRSSPPLA